MDVLARLHARFYKSADASAINSLPTWPDFFTSLEKIGFSGICANGFRAGESVIPARLFAREAEIWPATEHSTEMHRGRCDYLTHGDVHLRNWYVAGTGAMGLSDWQCSTRGHWSRDVAYAVTASTPFEMLPALEKPLLAYYLKQLAANGGPVVAFEDAWQDYIEQLFSALSYWTVTLTPSADMPDMQPRDSTLEMIRRIAASIDDNAALDNSRIRIV
jgi:aminoglycoside phosphotransferase (APT) family kinase protein